MTNGKMYTMKNSFNKKKTKSSNSYACFAGAAINVHGICLKFNTSR